MKLLLRGGRILDPSRNIDRTGSILLSEDGAIEKVFWNEDPQSKKLSDLTVRQIDASGYWVLPGLVDLHVHFRDPGQTYKEDLVSGARAAAAGGFTTVCCMPNTRPVLDNGSRIRDIVSRSRSLPYARVLPVGAVTIGQQGRVLTNAREMKGSGACALSEDGKSVADIRLMQQAMLQAREAGIPVFDHCETEKLAKEGKSRQAEASMVEREIELCRRTGAVLHICHISLRESLELVRSARKEGLPVTAETCPHYFTFDSSVMQKERSGKYKMNPPLRSPDDVEAMKEGLADGSISCVCTDHAPHAPGEKEPYETALNGIVGLETSVGAVLTHLYHTGWLSPLRTAAVLSTNAAKILNSYPEEGSNLRYPGMGTLCEGAPADISLIDPDLVWTPDPCSFYSRGRSCPFEGMTFTGRTVMTILQGRVVYAKGDVLDD